MEVHQLKLFLAVLECSSVTKAAEKVNLSPGAVSLQLHRLASDLRTELFVLTGKRLVPTAAAYRLAEHARTVINQMQQLQRDFENDPSKDNLPFHFATGVTTLIYQLGHPLRLLRERYPNSEMQVSVAVTEEIVAGLRNRRFDLGLISLPVSEEKLKIMPLYEEELLVISPSSKPVRSGQVSSIQLSELVDVPFLLYPKSSNMRSIIDTFFQELGLSPRVAMEADDTEAIKRLVESGFGYSILPEHALRGRTRFFHMHRVAKNRLIRKQALAMAETAYPRKLTESIAEFLQAKLRQK